MSTGTQVNIICVQLEAVLREIHQATLNLLAKGKTPNMADARNADYFKRLEAWKDRVEGLARQLGQLRAGVEGQRNIRTSGGGSEAARIQAFRANQSLNDQAASVEKAQALARKVSDALSNLLQRSINPTAADLESSASSVADKGIEFAKKLQALESSISQAERAHSLEAGSAATLRTAILDARNQFITTPRVGGPAPDFFGMATLLLTLVRVFWLEQIRKSRRQP